MGVPIHIFMRRVNICEGVSTSKTLQWAGCFCRPLWDYLEVNLCWYIDKFQTAFDTKWQVHAWIHTAAMWSMPKCQRIPNNGGVVARYTSCVLRRSSMRAQEPSGNLHISGDLQTYKPSPLNIQQIGFSYFGSCPAGQASYNWFHFVLLLDKHRAVPNRACLIRPPITTWNWVCIGDARGN